MLTLRKPSWRNKIFFTSWRPKWMHALCIIAHVMMHPPSRHDHPNILVFNILNAQYTKETFTCKKCYINSIPLKPKLLLDPFTTRYSDNRNIWKLGVTILPYLNWISSLKYDSVRILNTLTQAIWSCQPFHIINASTSNSVDHPKPKWFQQTTHLIETLNCINYLSSQL